MRHWWCAHATLSSAHTSKVGSSYLLLVHLIAITCARNIRSFARKTWGDRSCLQTKIVNCKRNSLMANHKAIHRFSLSIIELFAWICCLVKLLIIAESLLYPVPTYIIPSPYTFGLFQLFVVVVVFFISRPSIVGCAGSLTNYSISS